MWCTCVYVCKCDCVRACTHVCVHPTRLYCHLGGGTVEAVKEFRVIDRGYGRMIGEVNR